MQRLKERDRIRNNKLFSSNPSEYEREDDFSIQNAISCSVVQQALNGNLKAFNIIVDMLRTKLETSEMIKNI